MQASLGAYFRRLSHDDVAGTSAEVAYRFLLATFPLLLFLGAVGSVLASAIGIRNPATEIVRVFGTSLPPAIAGMVTQSLATVVDHAQPGLAIVGFITALWAAAGGVLAITKALNRAFEVEETRGFAARWVRAIGLTVLGGGGILVVLLLIAEGSVTTGRLAGGAGLASIVMGLARWPVIVAVLVLASAAVLRMAPNAVPSWRWCLRGGVAFTAGWLVATLGLALYISTAGYYGSTYGVLGGVVVLMLWYYLTGLVLLAAGELAALGQRVAEPGRAPQVRREHGPERLADAAVAGAKEKLPAARRTP